jgi:predicted DNA binding CopG/RHH family protein
MSDLKLQQDELELLASYEAEEWKSVKNLQEQKEQYRAYARATFRKDKRVNIRISEKDLLDLQRQAIRQGIPYQTLLSSVLHKYANGALTEK